MRCYHYHIHNFKNDKMIHLIKTPQGKFELYFVVKGRREWDTTPQLSMGS